MGWNYLCIPKLNLCNRLFYIGVVYFHLVLHWQEGGQGWGLLKLRSSISPKAKFLISQKYLLHSLNHIHIWQVSPQLRCGNTCQIWTCYSITNMYYGDVEKLGKNGTEEIGFVTPTPGQIVCRSADNVFWKKNVLGWRLLSQFSPFRYFPNYSEWYKQWLPEWYQVYIWQVSPQLSCGDTWQIWTWLKVSNLYFCKIKISRNGEINERSFRNPHPCISETIKNSWCSWR